MKDFIAYIDTDSLFIEMMSFLETVGISKEDWELLSDKIKIAYVIKMSEVVEAYVDEKAFTVTQKESYNSAVDDFQIGFKQEVVCKKALFSSKKKYGFHMVNKEGIPKDEISVTGLEIIRSDTPTVFRIALKDILSMILKGATDDELTAKIEHYKKELKGSAPEAISTNMGVKNLKKYIVDGISQKGAPFHVKGVANYRKLLKELGIEDRYRDIEEDSKNKVVYCKPNKWNMDTITYTEWPKEFTEAGLDVDYDRMLQKYFIGKCEILLDPINKLMLLDESALLMEAFF